MSDSNPLIDFGDPALFTKSLRDKTLLITGGCSGIGFATVKLFSNSGAFVVVGDLSDPAGDVKEFFDAAGEERIIFKRCDVTKWDQQVALFQYGVDRFGKIDVVSANAGLAESTNLLADDLKEPFLKTIEVNVNGIMFTAKLALYHFRRNPSGGSLVFTASAAGYFGSNEGLAAYVTSKHAAIGLLRVLAADDSVVADGISVSAVAPGLTSTPILSVNRVSHNEAGATDDPAWRLIKEKKIAMQGPEAPALTIAWLASKGKEANGMGIFTNEGLNVDLERGIRENTTNWMGKEMIARRTTNSVESRTALRKHLWDGYGSRFEEVNRGI